MTIKAVFNECRKTKAIAATLAIEITAVVKNKPSQ